MLPKYRPFSVIYLIFVWFFGLCYGFVLLSSAAGHNGDATVFEPGDFLTYDWQSLVRFDERENTTKNVGFYISGTVQISTVWAQNTLRIAKFEIKSPNLHVKSRKAPTPEGFIPHSSRLEEFKNTPFYIVWNKGKVEKILLAKGERISLANIKKGIASLFQLQFYDGAYFETDSSGKCAATYTALSPVKILKTKSKCFSDDVKYQKNVEPILGVEVTSLRTTEYEFDQTLSYLKSVTSKESHNVFVNAKDDLGNAIEIEQKLTFVSSQKTKTVQAETAEGALEEIRRNENVIFTHETLLTESEQSSNDLPRFTKEVANLKEGLLPKYLGTLKSAKAFLKLLEVARAAKKEDVIKVLEYKKNEPILPQLYDILGYVQTKNSHEAVMKSLHFDRENQFDLSERYLWSLSMCSHPNFEIVEDILLKFKNYENIPDKLKETIILTLATMSKKLSLLGDSLKTVERVEETILQNLDYAKGEQKYPFFRALKNLQKESTIPILLSYIKKGTIREGVLAFKALRSFEKEFFDENVLKTAHDTFLQLHKKHDSSSRTIAADILLESNINYTTLDSLFDFLQSNETNYEIKQYTLQSIKMKADSDQQFARMVQKIIRKNPKLNNYSVLSPRGLSTALRREFFKNPSTTGSLVSIQEVSSGIAKRGIVNVVLEKDHSSSELFSLGIFSGGLTSFMSNNDAEDEEDESPTAGMELTVLGSQVRPFVFFSSNGELMGHVWSGTASERTPAFQANIMLQDHFQNLRLSNGFFAQIDIKGVASFDLSGKIEISLWNRNAQGLVEKSAGILVMGQTKIDSELVKTQLDFSASVEPKLSLNFDADFSGDVKMCMRLTQPDNIYRHNIFKVERIPGSKHKLRIAKYKKSTIPGKTYSLNRKNNEMCNAIFN